MNVELDDWETGSVVQLVAAQAATYEGYRLLDQLKPDEVETCQRWVALFDKLKKAAES